MTEIETLHFQVAQARKHLALATLIRFQTEHRISFTNRDQHRIVDELIRHYAEVDHSTLSRRFTLWMERHAQERPTTP